MASLAAAARSVRSLAAAGVISSSARMPTGLASTPPTIPSRFTARLLSSKSDQEIMATTAEELAKVLKEQPSKATATKAESLVKQLSGFFSKAPVEKMTATAEELCSVLKKQPSDANTTRAQTLVKQLSDYYNVAPAEMSKPLSLGEFKQQNLVARLSKMEMGLGVNNAITAVMASVIGGGLLVMYSDMSGTKILLSNLKDTSLAEFQRIKKELFRMDSRLSNVEPKHCCPTCGVAVVVKNAILDDVPEEEKSTSKPSSTAQDHQGWLAWISQACKKLYPQEGHGETEGSLNKTI